MTIILSTTSRCVPFLEHNDTTRCQMGCAQTRQAVTLLQPHVPYVRSGYEEQYLDYTSYCYRATYDGRVVHRDRWILIVKYDTDDPICPGEAISLGWTVANRDGFDKRLISTLNTGDTFTKGTLLARHPSISPDGFLRLGKNLMTTFISCPYNYKDAIAISETCAKKMAMRYVHSHEMIFEDDAPIVWINDTIGHPQGTFVKKADPIFVIKPKNPLFISSVTHPGKVIRMPVSGCLFWDVEVDCVLKTPKEIAAYDAIYDKQIDDATRVGAAIDFVFGADPYMADAYKRRYMGHAGDRRNGSCIVLRYWIVEEVDIQRGSKLSNRHGNKGVVSVIFPDKDAPHTEHGEVVDVILNPMSIPSRRNVGQLFELHITRAMNKTFNKAMVCDTLDERKALVGNFLQKVQHPRLTELFMQQFNEDMWNDMVHAQGFQMISRPFESYSYETLLQTCHESGLGPDLKEPVTFGGQTINAAIGYNYWYRLEHEPFKKIFGRSVGAYGRIGQPIRGSNAHRLGELEIWALLAHQAYENIVEMMVPKSDNMTETARMLKALHDGHADLYSPHDTTVGAMRLMKIYLQAAGYDCAE